MPCRAWASLALAVVLLVPLAACGSTSSGVENGVVRVVAGANVWGDIAAQLGGAHAKVTSIINDASTDPHEYEPNPRDAAAVGGARIVIANGLGYDDFVGKLVGVTSNRHRVVLTVAKILGVSGHDANPHLWYDIAGVRTVAQSIRDALVAADPSDARAFDANLARFDRSLEPLFAAIETIRTRHPGAPVAYTERVPEYLLVACGLAVKSPSGFARAIEDGNEPSARDTHAMETLVKDRRVDVLLYNAQAASPVTEHIRKLAQSNGVPVVGVTETIPRSEPSYQSWQLGQLRALLGALDG